MAASVSYLSTVLDSKSNQRTIGLVNAHLISGSRFHWNKSTCLPRFFQKRHWPSIPSLAQLIVCIYQLSGHRLQWLLKNPRFSFFPIEKDIFTNLTLHKIGQGQPRVIIWTNYDGLASPMLHTNVRGNWSTGFGEDFWRVFTIYGRGGHLGHVTQMPRTKFCSPYPTRLHLNWLWSAQHFPRCISIVDGRTPTADLGYTISSPMSLWLRWAKNATPRNSFTIHSFWDFSKRWESN